MRKLCILAFFCQGCLSNNTLGTESMAQINVPHLQELHIGMSEEQVFQIMRAPSETDRIVLDDDCYDVWFYVTRATGLDQSRFSSRNLTPVIFKNGVFVAIGHDYYKKIVLRSKESPQKPTPQGTPGKKPIDLENLPLEETLKNPTTSSSIPTDQSKSKPVQKEEDETKKPPIQLDEEDDRMLEDSQEQDFNQW